MFSDLRMGCRYAQIRGCKELYRFGLGTCLFSMAKIDKQCKKWQTNAIHCNPLQFGPIHRLFCKFPPIPLSLDMSTWSIHIHPYPLTFAGDQEMQPPGSRRQLFLPWVFELDQLSACDQCNCQLGQSYWHVALCNFFDKWLPRGEAWGKECFGAVWLLQLKCLRQKHKWGAQNRKRNNANTLHQAEAFVLRKLSTHGKIAVMVRCPFVCTEGSNLPIRWWKRSPQDFSSHFCKASGRRIAPRNRSKTCCKSGFRGSERRKTCQLPFTIFSRCATIVGCWALSYHHFEVCGRGDCEWNSLHTWPVCRRKGSAKGISCEPQGSARPQSWFPTLFVATVLLLLPVKHRIGTQWRCSLGKAELQGHSCALAGLQSILVWV